MLVEEDQYEHCHHVPHLGMIDDDDDDDDVHLFRCKSLSPKARKSEGPKGK